MLADKRGLATAITITSEPMSETLKADLGKSLEKVFSKKITLRNEVDKSLLGGVVVKVGNYTIDLSNLQDFFEVPFSSDGFFGSCPI